MRRCEFEEIDEVGDGEFEEMDEVWRWWIQRHETE